MLEDIPFHGRRYPRRRYRDPTPRGVASNKTYRPSVSSALKSTRPRSLLTAPLLGTTTTGGGMNRGIAGLLGIRFAF